jgi:hypothetical protein
MVAVKWLAFSTLALTKFCAKESQAVKMMFAFRVYTLTCGDRVLEFWNSSSEKASSHFFSHGRQCRCRSRSYSGPAAYSPDGPEHIAKILIQA